MMAGLAALTGCCVTGPAPQMRSGASTAVNLTQAQTAVVRIRVAPPPGSKPAVEPPPEAVEQGLVAQYQGSGVVIEPGCILTCAHVVEEADGGGIIWVETPSPKVEVSAKVIGVDRDADLALLRCALPAESASAVRLAEQAPSAGQSVYAVGFPLGLGRLITRGIISADGGTGLELSAKESYLVTDAAVGLGNSGGGLFDDGGRLLGVICGVMEEPGSGRPLGLVIPAAMVQSALKQLRTGKPVGSGFLGARVGDQAAPLDGADGVAVQVCVADIIPDSPADEAGLIPGDVILKASNQPLASAAQLQTRCLAANPGDTLALTIWRNGQTGTLEVKLGDRFADENAAVVCDFCPHCMCRTF